MRINRLTSINFSVQGGLKANFNGHAMHDVWRIHVFKGEFAVGEGAPFLVPRPVGKGQKEHAAGSLG